MCWVGTYPAGCLGDQCCCCCCQQIAPCILWSGGIQSNKQGQEKVWKRRSSSTNYFQIRVNGGVCACPAMSARVTQGIQRPLPVPRSYTVEYSRYVWGDGFGYETQKRFASEWPWFLCWRATFQISEGTSAKQLRLPSSACRRTVIKQIQGHVMSAWAHDSSW